MNVTQAVVPLMRGAEVRGHRQHRVGEHAPVPDGRGHLRHVQVRPRSLHQATRQGRGPGRHPGQLRRPRSGAHQVRRHPPGGRARAVAGGDAGNGRRPSSARSRWAGWARRGTSPTPPSSSRPMSAATPPDRSSTCPAVRSCRRRPSQATTHHSERGEREQQVRPVCASPAAHAPDDEGRRHRRVRRPDDHAPAARVPLHDRAPVRPQALQGRQPLPHPQLPRGPGVVRRQPGRPGRLRRGGGPLHGGRSWRSTSSPARPSSTCRRTCPTARWRSPASTAPSSRSR